MVARHEDLYRHAERHQHDWHVVDAAGVPLGRLASAVAQLIRGKHKPTFTPHMDGGDFVIVLNASKVKLTGRKLEQQDATSRTPATWATSATPSRATCWTSTRTGSSRRRCSACCPRTRSREQKLRGKLKVYAGAGASARRAAAQAVHRHSRRRRAHDRCHPNSAGRPLAAARPASPGSTSPRAPASGTSTAARWVTTSPVRRWCSTSSSRSPPPTPWARSTCGRM